MKMNLETTGLAMEIEQMSRRGSRDGLLVLME
jgi:hypothetical protein